MCIFSQKNVFSIILTAQELTRMSRGCYHSESTPEHRADDGGSAGSHAPGFSDFFS